MAHGQKEQLTAAELQLIMQLLYDHDSDGAGELHDKLVALGASRLYTEHCATITIWDEP